MPLTTLSTMQPIKVSIIGTGTSLSGLHYPSIASLPDKYIVHSVLERTPRGVAQSVCGEKVKVVTTLEEVVNDPEVELVSTSSSDTTEELISGQVVITSPNNTHHSYTTTALNAGKHGLSRLHPGVSSSSILRKWSSVLVEKPITPTSSQAQDLVDLASSKNLILTVYQNRRWDSDFLTVQQLLQTGRVSPSPSHVPLYLPIPQS